MNTFIMIGLAGSFVVTGFSLIRALEYKRIKNVNDTLVNWQYSLLLIFLGMLFFFVYFNSTMQALQTAETVIGGSDTFIIANNNYVEYFSYLPYVGGMMIANFIFNVVVFFRSFEAFGRQRLKPNKKALRGF